MRVLLVGCMIFLCLGCYDEQNKVSIQYSVMGNCKVHIDCLDGNGQVISFNETELPFNKTYYFTEDPYYYKINVITQSEEDAINVLVYIDGVLVNGCDYTYQSNHVINPFTLSGYYSITGKGMTTVKIDLQE